MKLHEEFKLYENMWESVGTKDWYGADAEVEFETSVYPDIAKYFGLKADDVVTYAYYYTDEVIVNYDDATGRSHEIEKHVPLYQVEEWFKAGYTILDEAKLREAVSSTYEATYAKMETRFKEAVHEANFTWMNALIDLGQDYNYFNSRVGNKLRKAAATNIVKDIPNAATEDLARTGDPKVDAAFEQFLEEEAGNFDESLDFFNYLYICYADGTYNFFDSYEDTFTGDKDRVECIIGIDYASGASITWIRGEDDLENLDYILEGNG